MDAPEETHLEALLMCPVCQDVFTDPGQLPCGHSLCLDCLQNLVDHSTSSPSPGIHCPDCRTHFGASIGLEVQKSYALSNVAAHFRENRSRRRKQNRDVHCDLCPETQTLAVRTCLKCEVSMCEGHVRGHRELPAFTGHPLVAPLGDLGDRKCPQHRDQVLKFYCSVSRRYVCVACAVEDKQQSAVTEASGVLRIQLMDYMDQRFTLLREQVADATVTVRKLGEELQREKVRKSPVTSSLNSVTMVLVCLWFIVLYYALHFSVENHALKEAMDKQQSHVGQVFTTIRELCQPMNNISVSETQDQHV